MLKGVNLKKLPILSLIEANFLLNFFAIFLTLFTFFHYYSLGFFLNSITHLESYVLSYFGILNYSYANQIVLAKASFIIVPECSGLAMCSMLIGLVFSTNFNNKIKWLLIFCPLLIIFNLLRLFFTIVPGALYGQNVLDLVHTFLWFVDTGVVFYLWTLKVERKDTLKLSGTL